MPERCCELDVSELAAASVMEVVPACFRTPSRESSSGLRTHKKDLRNAEENGGIAQWILPAAYGGHLRSVWPLGMIWRMGDALSSCIAEISFGLRKYWRLGICNRKCARVWEDVACPFLSAKRLLKPDGWDVSLSLSLSVSLSLSLSLSVSLSLPLSLSLSVVSFSTTNRSLSPHAFFGVSLGAPR